MKRLALALASIAAALAAVELGLRVAAWFAPPPAPIDPDLAVLGVPIAFNRQGFRGPEVTPEPRPGVYRIAVVGDSFSAGVGVPEADAYAAQLERLLRASGAGIDFEVVNLGMSGLNIEQVLARAASLGAGLHPHLYVYGYTLNDILEGGDAERHMLGGQRGALRERLLHFQASPLALVRVFGPRWLSLRQAWWPADDDYSRSLARAYRDPARFARVERGLDGFAALAQQTGTCVEVLIHTELAHLRFAHPFRDAYADVERAAHARGLGVTPTFEAHRWRDPDALRLSVLDGHPNAEGHRILAEALYRGLRELPPHCRFPALP